MNWTNLCNPFNNIKDAAKVALGFLVGSTIIGGEKQQACAAEEVKGNPNFIFILADDLGWNGIDCGENSGYFCDSKYYKTPNIKRLREKSMRFSQAYVACPFCGPTRASIMTGKYPQRVGITDNISVPLPLQETTIPEALDNGGVDYLSAFVGKWNLSYQPQTESAHYLKPGEFGPDSQGFDYNYGGSWLGLGQVDEEMAWIASKSGGSVNAASMDNYWEGNNNFFGFFNNKDDANYYKRHKMLPGWYQADRTGSLLYPGLGDPDRTDPNEFLTDSLTRRAEEFLQLAEESHRPFMLFLAYHAPHAPILSGLNEKLISELGDRFDETTNDNGGVGQFRDITENTVCNGGGNCNDYAALIKRLDENIGNLLFDENGELAIPDNTYVFFYSDNGGAEKFTDNAPLRGGKNNLYEGGIRVPLLVMGPDIDEDSICNEPVSSVDIFPTIIDLAYPDKTFPRDEYPAADGVSFAPLLNGNTEDFSRNADSNYLIYQSTNCYGLRLLDSSLDSDPNNKWFETVEKDYMCKIDAGGHTTVDWPDYRNPDSADTDENDCKYIPEDCDPEDCDYSKDRFDYLRNRFNTWRNSLRVELRKSNESKYYDTISSALLAAADGDTVILPCSTFHENITIDVDITIQSTDPGNWMIVKNTVIDGFSVDNEAAITLNSNSVVVKGLTITGGSEGGIQGNGADSNSRIENCIISYNNSSGNGAGISNFGGEISRCKIYNNISEQDGGGLYNCDGIIKSCEITSNIARGNDGGLADCDGVVVNCMIVGNSASAFENNYSGTANIKNSILDNCDAGSNIDTFSAGLRNIWREKDFVCGQEKYLAVDYGDIPTYCNEIHISNVTRYHTGDVVEHNNDGIRRLVLSVVGNNSADSTEHSGYITINPGLLYKRICPDSGGSYSSLISPAKDGDIIYNWGQNPESVIEDYHSGFNWSKRHLLIEHNDGNGLQPWVSENELVMFYGQMVIQSLLE
jgi:arylsulfatase A-like enzyme